MNAAEPGARLDALAVHLKAHGFMIEQAGGGLVVRNPAVSGCCADQETAGDMITCRPYEGDGGRYWYFTSWQQPIAEADRLSDALVMIKGYLRART